MKRSLLATLCAAALFLGGCAPTAATPAQTEDTAQYEQTIAALEAELQRQKELLYIAEYQYKTELLSLRAQLDALTAGAVGEPDATPSEAVFRYQLSDKGATITGYSGSISLLNIPGELDGHPVIAIGERAFAECDLTAVVLPEGIRSVGWFAFYGCRSLLHVTLPQSLSTIGYAVFDGCDGLTLFCPAGSYAEAFAKSYGMNYIAN